MRTELLVIIRLIRKKLVSRGWELALNPVSVESYAELDTCLLFNNICD